MSRKSALILAAGLLAATARADPGYYVVTPYVNEGLVIADFRYWTVTNSGWPEVIWPEVGIAYGVTSRWTTELFMSWVGVNNAATKPSTLNWQNNVLLTQGELPLDIALHLQLIGDRHDAHHRTVEFGPLLQTDFGRTQVNANLIIERGSGLASPQPTQLKYQWQLRYRWIPAWHVGLQGFGELGTWNDWAPHAQQSHRAGPALFGTWRQGDKTVYRLQAGWLTGKTYGTSGHLFTLRATAEF